MAIVDWKTGKVKKSFTVPQLIKAANYMRGLDMVALNCAGSGHSGGTLSIMDIAAALYLSVARHDPKNPNWDYRDRIIWSGGHKAPSLYLSLGMSGYFPVEDVVTLRKFGSRFQGHPHWLKLPGVEVSTGSLGQGFGIGVGIALRGKLDKKDYRVYVITGDGEWDEGSMWESTMEAVHYALDNLVVVIDRNYLQIDGPTEAVMKLDPMEKRIASFGFEVIKINGHNMGKILAAFSQAKKVKGKPVAIIARTVKGKGVSFMENVAGWHGKSPNDQQLEQALIDLKLWGKIDVGGLKAKAAAFQKKVEKQIGQFTPKFSRDYFWNKQEIMKVTMEPTRFGFGKALSKSGGDQRVICLGLDISESVQIAKFYEDYPERKSRFLSVGIQEQGATTIATGLAREGKLPVLSTYGVFCSQRNADQMRTSVCYGNFNVLFGGAHGGISVGADGATHQSLEEIAVVGILPNMHLVVPCDSVETQKATEYLLFKVKGPKYIRFAREATPLVTDEKTPFVFGKANIIRFRGEKNNFKEAYDTVIAADYEDEKEKVAIIACGPQVPEAMRAAWILKKEHDIETRILNIHTVKPLDKKAIVRTAAEVEIVVTAEEHQKGGLGNLIASAILEANLGKLPKFAMIGVDDRFGESGAPWELIAAFGLSAEHIAKKVLDLIKD
ncbi:transketolase [Candidatus Gottesmanbacteria bacterium]|nr:transketolase [Candidatus Gottesmanbacteria bacterium]